MNNLIYNAYMRYLDDSILANRYITQRCIDKAETAIAIYRKNLIMFTT